MLELAAVLALATRCAPDVAPQTLAAIAHAESGFNMLAIGVNRGPRPSRPASDPTEAARVARGLLDRGADLDLGLAQINSRNLAWLGLTVETVFDPCINLAAAARVLRAGYRPREGRDPQRTLRSALSRYNTGHPERGLSNGYVARVETAARDLGLTPLSIGVARPPSPQSSAASAWHVSSEASAAGPGVTIVFGDRP